ncbi:PDGLE domain-containing protein [Paenibacillus oenotherae]|uniref:PDGLE domain-containing protein n=2 Tax=Paenibacillus oenotherae TaxID=1435645 RepID=A0ABS7DCC9_9BACL|nr:PDGLE domain-containing protein [Paenibacillus oenotherae]
MDKKRLDDQGKPGNAASGPENAKSYVLTINRTKWAIMLTATLAVAGLLSPWASSSPDGLERVAEDHGFLDTAGAVHQWAPIPDYEVGGLPGNALKVGAAGVIGVLVMLAALWAVSRDYNRNSGSGGDTDVVN